MIQEPPAGSTIVSEIHDGAITYRWSPAARHPIQWIPAVFGGFMIVGGICMPIAMLSQPVGLAPPVPVAITFAAVLLSVGGLLAYAGLKQRGKETLKLSTDSIEYDTGPPILSWPLMLWFGPMFLHGPQMFGGMPLAPAHFVRKQYNFSPDSIGSFTLERIGERQRLRVDHGADRIEIGALLREPEREWLAEQLANWQSSHQSGS